MTKTPVNIGLTAEEVKIRQEKYGKNELSPQKKESFLKKIFGTISEPMFLLLIIAATIYFILGEPSDGSIMLIFISVIIGIEIFQEWKTDKTLNALKELSEPTALVIRDGKEQKIPSKDLVKGDIMMVHEGIKLPADGFIIKSSDFRVDESSLTGESEPVWKTQFEKDRVQNDYWRNDYCYAGTLVTLGTATIEVDKIGSETEYGKIGLGISKAIQESSPLQKQISKLVKTCATIAGLLFILVCLLTWFNLNQLEFKERFVKSILSGLTLAMSLIPEEFPVVYTVFLSVGAWRLAKKNSIIRKLSSIETLGMVSVLCVDKTGTITKNQMSVNDVHLNFVSEIEFAKTMSLACEIDVYDPMEKAMLDYSEKLGINKDELFKNELIKEYPFTDDIKMMAHVWKIKKDLVIAAKGSPENIVKLCNITNEKKEEIFSKAEELSSKGLRVIAVAGGKPEEESLIPHSISELKLEFLGLVGLSDPPKDGIKDDISRCKNAGIRVVMITGDNGNTALTIAKQVGITDNNNIITGKMLEKLSDSELQDLVKTTSIFSRVIPEHKMRIVEAFKNNGEIVAMTGDGVNDAPALKYANIGIAMGKRGSEVSREAADLILMDDNFTTIVETIKDGRRIYDNLKKTIGYIITIHMPIALATLFAPVLGISPSSVLLLPVHIVILEILIDPTCTIAFERQPPEKDIMNRKPRKKDNNILEKNLLIKSLTQGFIIFLASFGLYYISLQGNPSNPNLARTMGISVIMIANLILIQVNSSDKDLFYKSILRLAKDKIMWAISIWTFFLLYMTMYSPVSNLLMMDSLTLKQFFTVAIVAGVSVFWYELLKIFFDRSLSQNITK